MFWQAVGNNVLIIVLSLLLQIPFSLGLAVLLNRRFPGRAIFRLLFFVPYVLSEAITGIVFSLLLQPDALVDATLQTVGLEGLIQDWLGNTDIVMITLFVIISWKYFGFHMILLLAGLQGIPQGARGGRAHRRRRPPAGVPATSPCRCSGRRSACRSSCRSSARSSCSTWSGS